MNSDQFDLTNDEFSLLLEQPSEAIYLVLRLMHDCGLTARQACLALDWLHGWWFPRQEGDPERTMQPVQRIRHIGIKWLA